MSRTAEELKAQITILEARNAPDHQLATLRQELAAAQSYVETYSPAQIANAQRQIMDAEYKRLYGDFEAQEAARQAAEERQRAAFHDQLAGQIDPALGAAVRSAAAGVEEARQAAQAARQRLAQHVAGQPAMLGNVTAWAKAKGQLEDEVSGYDAVLAARERDHQRAANVYRQAIGAAWQRDAADAARELERVIAAGRAEIQAAEQAVDKAYRNANQAEQAARQRVNALNRYRPQ